LLRSEGEISRLACSSMAAKLLLSRRQVRAAPLLPHSAGSLPAAPSCRGGAFEARLRGIQRDPEHWLTAVFHIPSVRAHGPEKWKLVFG
jgi:hypothetical protein